MTSVFAHETWFDHGAYPADWGRRTTPAAAAEAVA
jgi:hypothetical protein